MPKRQGLLTLVRHYFGLDPVQAAHQLEGLSEEEAAGILKALPASLIVPIFPHLPIPYAVRFLSEASEDLFRTVVEQIEPQRGAELFTQFSREDKERLLNTLSPKKKKEIQELLTYPEDSAGRIFSADFIAFHQDLKVRETIQKIRQLSQKGPMTSYTYVVDAENRLVGILNMRDLLLANPDQSLGEIMRRDLFMINGFMDRETVAHELSRRGFFAAPVVDSQNHLLGVVRAEALIEDIQEEGSEDIQKMFGAGGDERAFSPVLSSVRMRLPWLYVNLGTAFLAAAVVSMFESLIAKITILAVFLPVVAGQGGNAGSQSLAVVIRGIVMREIPKERVKNFILKEMGLGLLNGVLVGAVTALLAWAWAGNPMLGVVIGLAMVANLCAAGLAGASIPLTMKAIGLDPAQCSGIFLTTVTDVVGFFSFLGLAVLFQSYLM